MFGFSFSFNFKQPNHNPLRLGVNYKPAKTSLAGPYQQLIIQTTLSISTSQIFSYQLPSTFLPLTSTPHPSFSATTRPLTAINPPSQPLHTPQPNMGSKTRPHWQYLIVFHLLQTCITVLSDASDIGKLITFKSSLNNPEALANWDPNVAPCNLDKEIWTGIICRKDGSVSGLRLENMGLNGSIDMDILSELPSIRTLSFANNSFSGPIPDVSKIGLLRGIYLSNNNFSGVIRDDIFAGMSGMRRVKLQKNKFTGRIPGSLTKLSILVDLQMQDNEFQGEIPDFEQKGLKVNFANNRLSGPIPSGLRNQDPSSFAGMKFQPFRESLD
ncbi:putative non-specific serine/threonine protein kinase [Helianthus anomalus]